MSALACADILGIKDVPDGATTDGTADVEAATDGGFACDPSTPFETPGLIVSLPTQNVGAITLSPDQLTAFVCEILPGTFHAQLFTVTRPTVATSFGAQNFLLDNACQASVAADGTFVWSYGLPPDSGVPVSQLYRGVLTGTGASLSVNAATLLSGLNVSLTNETAPFILPDGTQLFFSSGSADTTIAIYQAGADAGFESATIVADLGVNPYNGVLTPDGLVIYFVLQGAIAFATRASVTDPFTLATTNALPTVVFKSDAGAQLAPTFVSEDRCTIYFTSLTSTTANDGSTAFMSLTYMATKTH